MIDPFAEAMRAVSSGTPLAYPLAAFAGAATSVGPCVAPRYVAITALAGTSPRPWRITATFAAGVVLAYVALGTLAGALGAVQRWSTAIDVALAGILIVCGAHTLFREAAHRCGDEAPQRASAGGALLLGVSSACVVSPCCTPVVAAIAGMTTLGGNASGGAALTAAFALGHVAPLFALAAFGARVRGSFGRLAATPALPVIGGTLMLGLGALYGALA